MKTRNCWLVAIGLLMMIGSPRAGLSQSPDQQQTLRNLSAQLSNDWQVQRSKAEQRAISLGLPIRFTTPGGTGYELQNFSGSVPKYYKTLNLDGAETIGTSRLWPSNPLGFQFSGQGIVLGLWDQARVLSTHQEFSGGRVTQADNPSAFSNHSTHVAGTMIATGVNPLAHGMSYQATLKAHDWDNDLSEMALESSGGLRVSNHSYGYVRGWDYNFFGDGKWVWFGDTGVSQTKDYLFGFYDDEAQQVDQVAVAAPNYVIVWAAGNDRSDAGPSPGTSYWYFSDTTRVLGTVSRNPDGGPLGYDCVADAALSKNVITVGAVEAIPLGYGSPSDVVMTSFSNWGPADDGRIKPDVVADGYQLTSCVATGTTSYDIYSGTSMATPCVSGSIGIILENEKRLYGTQQFKSSTIKGLIIHTADEAGPSPGPDYMFGWGLMNTYRAVQLMNNDKLSGGGALLREVNLTSGSTIQIPVKSKGIEPLKVTICWLDPAGTVLAPAVDQRTPALVNDIDLRITGGSTVYLPWRLDATNPSAAAVQADNSVDNVEQVLLASPAAGNYTIKISHKGTLTLGHQLVSVVISGIDTTTTNPNHFTFAGGTGNNGTVAIPLSSNPKVGATAISSGDEIGAFTPQGLCVGAVVWTGQNAALTVWGDNDQTTTKDGLAVGDTIMYRIWQSSTNKEYSNVPVTYTQGNGIYAVNGIYVIGSMTQIDAPPVPGLTSPSNGSTGVSLPVTFHWNASVGATSYMIQIAKDTTFATKTVDTSGVAGISLQLGAPKLQGGTTYYWRVQAAVGSLPSGWTPRWQFATGTSLVHFTFASGTGNNGTISIPISSNPKIGTTALVSGDEIGGFTPQGLCVGAVVWTGQNAALTVWGDNDQTGTKDGLAAGDTIMYRIWQSSTTKEFTNVQVTYTQGNGIYAANGIYVIGSISAATAPSVPVLTSPSNGAAGVLLPATLQWNTASGAASYMVQVAKDTAFATKVVDTSGVAGTSLQLGNPKLQSGTTYYWRVQAVAGSQTSGWSVRWFFASGLSPVHFIFTSGTGNNGTISIPALSNPKIGTTAISSGDEIGAFTPEGLCVGAVVWTGQNAALTVWGDNDKTTTKDGLTVGDTIMYRIWQSSTNKEYSNVPVTYTQGNGIYAVNGVYVIGTMTGVVTGVSEFSSETPHSYRLAQNYPNPFNPSTTIRFAVPNRSFVLLEIVNTLGEHVTTLVNGELNTGFHEVTWNANVCSGIYFCRIIATSTDDPGSSFVEVKKMLLMR